MERVQPSDAESIADLDVELFPENCFNSTTLRREIEAGSGFVIYDNELVGYLLIRRDHEIIDITRVGVRPSHQGHGLGTSMLMEVIGQSASPVILTVRKDNHGALRLYHSIGFRIVAETNNSWIMKRQSHRLHSERPAT